MRLTACNECRHLGDKHDSGYDGPSCKINARDVRVFRPLTGEWEAWTEYTSCGSKNADGHCKHFEAKP